MEELGRKETDDNKPDWVQPESKSLQEKSAQELEAELELIKREQQRRKEHELKDGRLLNRAAFDMPAGMKEIIKEIADKFGTTNSQVASFLLAKAIISLKEGDIEIEPHLTPSRSPRRPFNIEIPEFRDPDNKDKPIG